MADAAARVSAAARGRAWRCSDPEADVVWTDDRWLLASMSSPQRLPFAALLMPREHLDLGDLDDDWRRTLHG